MTLAEWIAEREAAGLPVSDEDRGRAADPDEPHWDLPGSWFETTIADMEGDRMGPA